MVKMQRSNLSHSSCLIKEIFLQTLRMLGQADYSNGISSKDFMCIDREGFCKMEDGLDQNL
jgi:hypothetical protein